MKILIVEDNAIQALLLKKLIDSYQQYESVSTTDYEDALTVTNTFNPDILMVDINLGYHKNGIDLVHEIQRKRNIPAIFVTGNSEKGIREQAEQTNCIGFVVKPVDKVKMHQLLQNMSNN